MARIEEGTESMTGETTTPAVQEFATGAVRGTDRNGVRYDLLPRVAMRRLAETCAEGAAKYGDHNWLHGMPSGDMLNHALAHVFDYLDGDRSEDHLAHAIWNLCGVLHNEERRPDMHAGLLGPGGTLTEEIRATLAEHAIRKGSGGDRPAVS